MLLRDILPRIVLPGVAATAATAFVGRFVTGPLRGFPAEDELLRKLVARRTPATDRWATTVSTASGVVATIGLAVASGALIAATMRNPRAATAPLAAIALETAVFTSAAAIVKRPRPDVPKLGYEHKTTSFPSGHTGAAVALYRTWATLLERTGHPAARVVAPVLRLAAPAAVAHARLHCGMHHPSDVVAGALIGAWSAHAVGGLLLPAGITGTVIMGVVERVLSGPAPVAEWQRDVYEHLHAHPELSMQESETCALIDDRLAAAGYEVQRIGGGVVGVLTSGPGPVVLLRADIDGLPVRERSGLPYASTAEQVDRNGVLQPVMHACGHDMHTTAALGAAALLAAHRDAWSGTYVSLFQPGEETAEGARAMVADGLVAKIPRPDVALAQHVLTAPEAGRVATASGPVLSTAVSLRVTVFGKGSHGAMPHLGVDPVVLAAAIVQRLQGIVARELAPGVFGVVTVGSLQAGTKANIIPDAATLLVNVRAYDADVRDRILAAIERIVRAECAASGADTPPTIDRFDEFPPTSNDPQVTERVTAAFVRHFGADRVTRFEPVAASEDFGIVPDAFGTPYCYWGFGGFTAGQEAVANHNPRFAPAIDPTLGTATEAAVVAALAYLGR